MTSQRSSVGTDGLPDCQRSLDYHARRPCSTSNFWRWGEGAPPLAVSPAMHETALGDCGRLQQPPPLPHSLESSMSVKHQRQQYLDDGIEDHEDRPGLSGIHIQQTGRDAGVAAPNRSHRRRDISPTTPRVTSPPPQSRRVGAPYHLCCRLFRPPSAADDARAALFPPCTVASTAAQTVCLYCHKHNCK